MATFHSGIASTATLDGTELATTRWSMEAEAEIVRFRNSKTDRFSKKESTYKEARGTIDADLDFDSLDPWAAPTNLEVGDTLTNVKLWTQGGGEGGDGPAFTLPSIVVTGISVVAETEGKITVAISFENDGSFTGLAA